MMQWKSVAGVAGILAVLWGCGAPQFQTLKILDEPDQAVALQVMPEPYEGKGYDHPVLISTEDLIRLLQGVKVQRGLLNTSAPQPAFSETEIRLFAPHFSQALQQATQEEIVTFFETAHIDSEHDLTTSGGLFVAGGHLYIVLSNFSVKSRSWQDVERYEAPYRKRPLEQMDPQPGRLVFEPREFMVESPDAEIGNRLRGRPWQMAIRYKEFLQKADVPAAGAPLQ